MEWTKETPTVAGLYWYWELGRGVRDMTISRQYGTSELYYGTAHRERAVVYLHPSALKGSWQGPISRPDAPTKKQREALLAPAAGGEA